MVAPLAAFGASQDDLTLKHDWQATQEDHTLKLTSNFRAPASYSETGEPEAILTTMITNAPEKSGLSDVLKEQVANIRSTLKLGDTPEQGGHKPVDGVISYIENIEGQDVGFIKYNVAGNANRTLLHPWSVTHAVVLKNGAAWFVHLMVIYPGHLDEVTADQMRLVRKLIQK